MGTTKIAEDEKVSLEPTHAITDATSFLSGVSASILAFLVFGTTKVFRDFYYIKLVPKCIRRKLDRHNEISPNASASWQDLQQRKPSQAPETLLSPVLVMPSANTFEMRDEQGGLGRRLSIHDDIHGVSTPTPSSSTFELQRVDHIQDDDEHPILDRNSQRLTAWPEVPGIRGSDRR